MYVRLAFAVAANLESEILIVDEVLAVGDGAFQKKCLGKMGDVSKGEGRTVLFVSHNMNTIANLCSKSVLLNSGKVEYAGDSGEAISRYANAGMEATRTIVRDYKLAEDLILEEFYINNSSITSLQALEFNMLIRSKTRNNYISVAIFIYDCYDQKIAFIDLRDGDLYDPNITNPVLFIRGKVKSIPFVPGIYSIGLHVQCSFCYKDYFNLVSFEVSERETDILPYDVGVRGKVELDTSFNLEKIKSGIDV
jgi:lipopolysaccharide transport system ATP-binding protein